MSKTALLILPDGAEAMEAVITIDIIRRGGISVTVAGLESAEPVHCGRDVNILPDTSLAEASKNEYDVIILPGGTKSAEKLSQSSRVKGLLEKQEKEGRLVAAICGAPLALKTHNIGIGKTVTSYPAAQKAMEEGAMYKYSEDNVVEDRKLITSRGPGTSFDFALAIVSNLMGPEKAESLAKKMLLHT